LSAALDSVSGDVVIVMDGDLQDRPEEIPRFVEAYKEGFDVVYATRVDRQERRLLRVCYYLFYRLMALVSDLRMPLDSGDFALLSRRVVDRINALPERNRYLRGLRAWVGFQQTGLAIKRDARAAGKPAYTVRKLMKLALDGLFAFSVAPLRAAAVIGGLTTAAAFVFAAYSIYIRVFLGESPQGFTALIVAIIFFAGVQLMFLGLIGEYLGRVYDEAKGRPHYIVSTVVGQRDVATRADLEVAFRREPTRFERIG
jgi:dolichol-phosphate mannosyltransferase